MADLTPESVRALIMQAAGVPQRHWPHQGELRLVIDVARAVPDLARALLQAWQERDEARASLLIARNDLSSIEVGERVLLVQELASVREQRDGIVLALREAEWERDDERSLRVAQVADMEMALVIAKHDRDQARAALDRIRDAIRPALGPAAQRVWERVAADPNGLAHLADAAVNGVPTNSSGRGEE